MLGLVTCNTGHPGVEVALIDGPIFADHPSLADATIVVPVGGPLPDPDPLAVAHATFIASMLVGRRGLALGLCPRCTLVSFPVVDGALLRGHVPASSIAQRFAGAIYEAVARRVTVIQLSLEFAGPWGDSFEPIREALAAACEAGIRTVVAAGNSGAPTLTPLLSAPGAVPVALGSYDGTPHPLSAWGVTIGSYGLLAPGLGVVGAIPPDGYELRSGSSYAASFVTAAFALLSTLRSGRDPAHVWNALLAAHRPAGPGHSLIPPPLDGDLSRELLEA
jgi:subtilisin family serine protease